MIKQLRNATFKFMDILVILTMVLGSPMSISAAAMAQDPAPVLATDKSDYAPGESAHVTGSGFIAGDYVLAANAPDGQLDWGTVSAGESGDFESDSPTLDSAGTYEVRAYASGWGGDWNDIPVASASFSVTAPPPPSETPTQEPTIAPTDTPTTEPTVEPTIAPSDTPTTEPTVEPTDTATIEPTATATSLPTDTPTPSEPPTIASDKADYQPGELVTLTGTGWSGDTTVTITVIDAVPTVYRDTDQVQVQADGTISDSFNLPTTFVDLYFVTARGAQTGRVATTMFTDAPALTLTKSASTLTYTAAGQTINYSYALKNTGTTDLNPPFTVADNKVATVTCPNINTVGDLDGVLDPNETITCTGTYTITAANVSFGYVANTATASSTNPGATSSNPDTRIVSIPVTCRNDTAGANDVPGQKDLTQECEAPSSVNPLVISWNWDVISQPGGNSADGCALFDTDNDGLANYALCVSWQTQRVMQAGYPQLYSCGDTRSDRCTGSVPQTIQNGTGCALELASDDPFSAGDSFPQDTKAFCSINLADVGGAQVSSLIDVCSYPSAIPNSAPSDCVIISTARGNLEIIKSVVPNDTSTNWNVSWTGPTPYSTTITGSGDTGIQTVNAGSYNLSEAAGTGTDLSLYDSTWACTVNGSPSSSGSGTSINGVSVANGNVVICTFTNTRKTGSLQIFKDVTPNAPSTNWNFAVTGPTPYTCSIAGDGSCTAQTVFTGSYTITETAGSGTILSDYGTSYACTVNGGAGPSGSGTTISGLTINKSDAVVCTFTNSQSPGTITVNKVVVPSIDTGKFNLLIDGTVKASDVGNGGTTGAVAVSAGSHTVSETAGTGTNLTDYVTTFSGDCDSSGTVSIQPNQNKTCTITNTRKGTIIVEKQTNPDGAAGSFTFTGTAFGTISDNGQLTVSNLAPGTYTSTENDPLPDFALTAIACDDSSSATPSTVNVGSRTATFKLDPGETVKCTFTNTLQQGTLTVIKHVVTDNGGTATASQWSIHVKSGVNEVSGSPQPGSETGTSYSLIGGTYNVSETGGPSGYTFTGFSGDCDSSGNVTVVPGQTKTCTVTNDDQAATLIVIKHIINDNGGTADAADFTMSVTGGNASPASFPGDEAGTSVTLDAGSYSVGETGPSGYTRSDSADCAGTIANGETKTCTVTNDDQAAHLIIIKHVINDNGGAAVAADFILDSGGTNDTPDDFAGDELGTTVTLDAGSYAVTETGPSGYTRSDSADCSGTIANGETKTCTVTNDDQAATLIIIKHVINDNGGSADASDFTMSVTGSNASPASFPGDESGTSVTLDAGSYSVSETGPSGYSESDSADCSGTIANGETKTCTITNNDQAATLIVIKHVINDNGGSADASDFTMSVTGGNASPASFPGDESGTSVTLDAGSYSVSETGPSGYSESDSADCSGTIANGETKTCTVTNDDQAATLIVIKHVINDNGGTADAADFTMSVTGGNASPASFPGDEAGTSITLDAGSYSVSETGPSGYSESDSADCSGTIANGETKTCTVTNDDQAATLIVIKHVINDNGGTADASDFTMSVTGGNASPASFPGDEAGTSITLDAGSYSVGETGPSGYTRSDSADCSGTIANGETKTCTVTNDDQAATLIVIKHVINNNGGTADASDFTLDSGGTNDSPDDFAGDELGTTVTLDAGSYNVTETGPSGYTRSDSADCAGTIANGETKTCTVTNDDQAATLIVIKHIINDNGGTADAADFTMSVTGGNASPASFPGDEAGTSVTLDAGSYSVGETGPSGYTRSDSADCAGTIANGETKTCTVTNDDQAAHLIIIKHVINDNGGAAVAADFILDSGGTNDTPDDFAGDELGTTVTLDAGSYAVTETGPSGYTRSDSADCSGTIANGETKTCTVTNDDQAATLIIIKHVINDNGGSADASDFTMSVTGSNASPASFPGDESGTSVTLDAGSYSVSETGPSGYSESDSADCSGTIANGETKTCTITNNDQAATLIVIKHVINDNGGTATATDFTLDSGGTNDSPDDFAGSEVGLTVTLDAGGYSVTETGPSGYSASFSADCAGSIANGQTKTCTVTNDDQAATLIVIKHVINDNGGSADASDFTMSVTGSNASPASFPGDESGTTVTLDAGSYSVTETGPSGYSESDSADCSGTIANGETKTCTITNNDQAATLIVIKHVVNDNGGTADAADFTMSVTGSNASPASFPGDESGTSVTLDAGSYSVSEAGPSGYSESDSADCSGTIANGETKTCTVTNDDQAATLIVIKHVINDNGGSADASDFTLDSGGTNDSPDDFAGDELGTTVTLDAGSYAVTETGPSGYSASFSADCSGSIANGETKTCTVTNDDQPATLIVIKHVINNNGGAADASDFTLDAGGTNDSPDDFAGSEVGTTVTLDAGSYAVTETGPSGYTRSDSADCSGTIANGETKTCTVTNDDQAATLIIIKHVINNNGGTAVAADFTLDSGGANDSPDDFAGDELGTTVTLDAGSYAVTETGPSGYTRSDSADCSGTIANGETKTCTVTNDDQAATLIVIKHVINNNGGAAVAADFSMSTGGTNASPADGFAGDELGTTVTLDAGSYNVTETGPSGYTASFSADCAGSIANGETKTCTVTNNDQSAHLIIIKHVINNNGGTAVAGDFTLDSGGDNDTPDDFAGDELGTTVTLDAGSFNVTETGPSGYSASFSVDCAGSIANGETKTCTVTNDDQAATLIVIKHVINDNGGTALASDFTLDSGGDNDSPDDFAGDELGTTVTLDAGSYAVTETGPAGYTRSDSVDCAGTIANGETKTCTVTNDDQAATLIVIKHVINNNGGSAVAADFTLDSGGDNDTPDDFAGSELGTTVTLDAGSYNVTETGPSGYSASFSADCSGSIANGETKTCTVTNDDQPATLIVIKHVINNNGGAADASDFTLDAGGTNDSPDDFAGSEVGTTVTLDAGSYAVTETGPSGYTRSDSADCSGTIANGETKTCTVTNDDQAATLIIIKHVINNNGGTAVAADFTLDSGGTNDSPDDFAGEEAPGTTVTLDAGSYNVTETGPSGYSAAFSADCSGSIANGQTKTCTVTNNDISPTLTVVKVLVPGTDTGLFNLQIDSTTYAANVGNNGTTGPVAVNAGTYTVGETAGTGTSLSNYDTVISGDCAADGTVTLALAQNKTCTITNTRHGHIIVDKATNPSGDSQSFNFTATGSGYASFSLTDAAAPNDQELSAGTYSVSETVPAGWDLTSATCSDGSPVNAISLQAGETVTCTFTNTKRGHIIVDKVTLPSGDTQSFSFTTTGSSYTGFSLTDAAAPNDQTLVPGTYSATEGTVAGWDLTGLTCTDPSGGTITNPGTRKATISLAAGETVTCTFTNTKRGKITIIKDALPNDAQDFAFTTTGTGLSSFNLDDDSNATLLNSKMFADLLPGAYSVTEGAVAGWDLTGLTCNDANGTTSLGTRTANIALDPGENVTCTFTNTKRGTIIVEKQTNPNGAPGNFTFTGTAAGTIADNGTITVSNLVPGTYTSTEANPAVTLFALTSIVCNDGSSANPSTGNLATRTATFKLDPGETVRCVFTNTKDFHPGTIGFWKNWRNHYTSAQSQLLINYLKSNNPRIYNKDLILNNADDFTIAKWDAIFNVGTSTPREHMILAQFTALKLNLAITQLDGTGGLVQKNDDICTAGVVNVSGISGAATFFGTSTPTVGQIVNAVENRWTGNLTTNRNNWTWNLTNAQKDMLINVITGINEGTLVMSSGCP